jgi:prepilin-type N-terminal cleavage/methylation domain-containing protein
MRRSRDAGFTLIEILLAMAILAFVTTMMWGSFSQTATNKRALEAAQERVHTARVALMRMARELDRERRRAVHAHVLHGVVAGRRRRGLVLDLRAPAPARRPRRGRHLDRHLLR